MTPGKIALVILTAVLIIGAIVGGSMMAGSILPKTTTEKVVAKPPAKKKPLSSAKKKQVEQQLSVARIDFENETDKLNILMGSPKTESSLKKEADLATASLVKANTEALNKSEEALRKADSLLKNPQVQAKIAPDRIVTGEVLYNWQNNPHPTEAEIKLYTDAINNYLTKLEKVAADLALSGETSLVINLSQDVDKTNNNLQNAVNQQKITIEEAALQPQVGNPEAIQSEADKVLEKQAEVAALVEQLSPATDVPSPSPSPGSSSSTAQSISPSPSPSVLPAFVPPPTFDPKKPKLLQGWTGN